MVSFHQPDSAASFEDITELVAAALRILEEHLERYLRSLLVCRTNSLLHENCCRT